MIIPEVCKKCGANFDIDTSKDCCPKCRGIEEPSKIDINKFEDLI